MLKIRETAVQCVIIAKWIMPISVVVRSGLMSRGPRSRLWDLPVSHLSPSLRVIPCEYVDDPYIAKT